MSKQMNGAEATAIRNGGGIFTKPAIYESEKHNGGKETKRSWLYNRLRDVEVITMAGSPTPDKNGQIVLNPSKLTFYLFVLITVAGLWWWTWQQATNAGHEAGKRDAEIEFLKQQQQETQAKAADAQTKATYAISKADGGDGHEPPKKGQEKKAPEGK